MMESINRISIQTGNWYDDLFGGDMGADEAFRYIKACGFDTLDYNIDHTIPVQNIVDGTLTDFYDAELPELLERYRSVKEAKDRHGIHFGQAHAPFPLHVEGREDVNDYLIMAIGKICAILQYLDCPALVVHPCCCADKEREKEVNLAMYRRMIPFGKQYGVKLCLENLFRTENGRAVASACSEAAEAVWYIDTLNAEAGEEIFGFCFDVGHAKITGRNIRQELRTLGHRLTILHIHENDGLWDRHLIPYTQDGGGAGASREDWEGMIQGLRDIQYQGTLNFETFAANDRFPKELLPAAIRFTAEIGTYFRKRLK